MKLTQEFADKLKNQPIDIQAMELLKLIESDSNVSENKQIYLQFEDILKDIKVANKAINSNQSGDFYQLRVDYVVKMRSEKNQK
jgi:hypothetical protein